MTTNGTQEGATLQASVAVEVPPQAAEVGAPRSGSGQENGAHPLETLLENPEGQKTAEEQPRGANGKEEIAALKATVVELKSALEAKASQEETQALKTTIGSLQDLLGENGARAQGEREEAEARAQQAVSDLKERLSPLKTNLENLERVVRAGRAQEQVEPKAVPPEVLQQVYEEILTEIFQEMAKSMGQGATRRTLEIMEGVRRSSSGMGFFRIVDDKRIVATGLTEAIRRGLLAPSQAHLTFNEFRRQLSAQIPQYQERRFEDLVGARTNAYSVATIRNLVGQAGELGERLDGLASRLDTLEGFTTRLVTLEDSIKVVTAATSSVNERISSLEQRIQ